jgi:hypothetical protein
VSTRKTLPETLTGDAADALTQALADLRGELPTWRKYGDAKVADAVAQWVDKVEAATESFRRFVPEADAALRSGRPCRWWRSQFEALARDGNARKERGQRLYRLIIVPSRARVSAARSQGRDAARRGAA